MGTFNERIISRTARPRSKRLRALYGTELIGGTATGSTDQSAGGGSTSAMTGHTHANMSVLDSLKKDPDRYLYIEQEDEEGDLSTEKVKSGYADRSGHATEAEHATKSDEATLAQMARELTADSPTRRDFISRLTDDEALGHITFDKGITAEVRTPGAMAGIAGSGVTVKNRDDGGGRVDTDSLLVRDEMVVMRLVIEEVKSVGGVLIVSRAAGKVEQADAPTLIGGERCQTLTLGDECQFEPGDYVRCSRWDSTQRTLKSYWERVTATQGKRMTITMGSGHEATEGDELVLMGSQTQSRSGFILVSTADGTEQVSVYAGVTENTPRMLVRSLKARLGRLDDIADSNFPDMGGYGLYSSNAYLRGELHVSSGGSVEEVAAEKDDPEVNLIAGTDTTVTIEPGRTAIVTRWLVGLIKGRSYTIRWDDSERSRAMVGVYDAQPSGDTLWLTNGEPMKWPGESGRYLIAVRSQSMTEPTEVKELMAVRGGKIADQWHGTAEEERQRQTQEIDRAIEGKVTAAEQRLNARIDVTQEEVSLAVKRGEMTRAGVTLREDGLTLTADKTTVKSTSGKELAVFIEEDGVPTINATLVKASAFIAKDDTGRTITAFNRRGDGMIEHYYGDGEHVQYESGPRRIVDGSGREILTVGRYYEADGRLVWWLSVAGMEMNSMPWHFDVVSLIPEGTPGANPAIEGDKSHYAVSYYRLVVNDEGQSCPLHGDHALTEHDGVTYRTPQVADGGEIPDGTYWEPMSVRAIGEETGVRTGYEYAAGRIVRIKQMQVFQQTGKIEE